MGTCDSPAWLGASQQAGPMARSSLCALRQQAPRWASPKPTLGGPCPPLPVLLHAQPVSLPQAHVPSPGVAPTPSLRDRKHRPEPHAWLWPCPLPLLPIAGHQHSCHRNNLPVRIPPDEAEKGPGVRVPAAPKQPLPAWTFIRLDTVALSATGQCTIHGYRRSWDAHRPQPHWLLKLQAGTRGKPA